MNTHPLPQPVRAAHWLAGSAAVRWQRGVAAVELGILLTPLILMVLGASEYGRAIHNYNMVVKSTRDAVRYLTQFPASDAANPSPASVSAAKNLVVFGNTAGTGSPLVAGLSLSNVDWCDNYRCSATHALQPTGGGTVNLVSIKVSGVVFTSLVPATISNIAFGPISATMGQVL
jgi:Flp pilus assembly protein TadG